MTDVVALLFTAMFTVRLSMPVEFAEKHVVGWLQSRVYRIDTHNILSLSPPLPPVIRSVMFVFRIISRS